MKKGRMPGAKDKQKRHPKGSGKAIKPVKFHEEVKARQASYPPLGSVHMNSGIPIPEAMENE